MGEFPAFITGWAILLEYILGISLVARCWSSMLDSLADNHISKWTIHSVGRYVYSLSNLFENFPKFLIIIIKYTSQTNSSKTIIFKKIMEH